VVRSISILTCAKSCLKGFFQLLFIDPCVDGVLSAFRKITFKSKYYRINHITHRLSNRIFANFQPSPPSFLYITLYVAVASPQATYLLPRYRPLPPPQATPLLPRYRRPSPQATPLLLRFR